MIKNVNLTEWLYLRFFKQTPRIEIVNDNDLKAKRLKPLTIKVADRISEKHPELKIIRMYKTEDAWNYNHPFLWGRGLKGYVISIDGNYDTLCKIKKTCIELEKDENGKRIADIDIYLSPFKKIKRKELSLKNN